ncbi:hypothetical protein M9H77_07177 [Catharanthus roseus]|uniref:Uncharacterized protein n=1 Tax=Catharanthus roseus TaxID=4058 RepID=A0ACC0BUF7_CATRO|nr:hypothetical protein M9H77_07177 [Catharanthus roseus]
MENEGSPCNKLYKIISFLPFTSFLSFDLIMNESNSCLFLSFVIEFNLNSLNFLTTTIGTKSNHGMKAEGEGMGKELSIGYEDTTISLSLHPSLLCYELSFKELTLFLELNACYMTLGGNFIVNPITCQQALDFAHMFKSSKSSSSCAYLEKQPLVSVARIKPSYHNLVVI